MQKFCGNILWGRWGPTNQKHKMPQRHLGPVSNTPALWKIEQIILGEDQKYTPSKAEVRIERTSEKHIFIYKQERLETGSFPSFSTYVKLKLTVQLL